MRDKDTLHVVISDETFKSDSKLLNGIDKIKKSKKFDFILISFKETYDFGLKNNLDKMKMLLPLTGRAVVFINYNDDAGTGIAAVIEAYEYNLPFNNIIQKISYGELNRLKRTKSNLIEI